MDPWHPTPTPTPWKPGEVLWRRLALTLVISGMRARVGGPLPAGQGIGGLIRWSTDEKPLKASQAVGFSIQT
jgi:hypothetical protein